MKGNRMSAASPARATEWDDAVACFLRANPDWLAAHPEIYRSLKPPTRVHGEALADHMAAMVLRERQHANTMTEQTEAVLAAGRVAVATMTRVHEAVVALIAAEDWTECLATELPHILVVDAVSFRLHESVAGWNGDAARLDMLLGARDVLFRVDPRDASQLYQEAAGLARHDVLIRLPRVGVLGLASRHSLGSNGGAAQFGLQFLGKAVAAIVELRKLPLAGRV
jgi:uncharacterized protein YigA (DUF484 family)